MAYSLPDLPYAYDALEPHIDEATMHFHHDKHHQAYVDKANAALEGTEWADKPIEEVLQNFDSLGEKKGPVKNNGGGHYNHSLFWESMSPSGGGEPSGELAQAIDSTFGSFADFQAKVKAAEAKAASVASLLPAVSAKQILPGQSGQMSGAPGAAASTTSATEGSGS